MNPCCYPLNSHDSTAQIMHLARCLERAVFEATMSAELVAHQVVQVEALDLPHNGERRMQ